MRSPKLHRQLNSQLVWHSVKEGSMLFAVAAALLVGWLLGMAGAYPIGNVVHLLLVIALAFLWLGWIRSIV